MSIRMVNTFMSKEKMSNDDIKYAEKELFNEYQTEVFVYEFKYDDSDFFEVDFDLDMVFHREKLFDEINRMISVHERIINGINIEVDIIIGNSDTDALVLKYEKDINDVEKNGFFITKRRIEGLSPYYSSDICNVYLNLDYESFGVL